MEKVILVKPSHYKKSGPHKSKPQEEEKIEAPKYHLSKPTF
jgi:hypothetical protein